jgi:hypothetical protein
VHATVYVCVCVCAELWVCQAWWPLSDVEGCDRCPKYPDHAHGFKLSRVWSIRLEV